MNMDFMNKSQNNPYMPFGEQSQPSQPEMPLQPSMPQQGQMGMQGQMGGQMPMSMAGQMAGQMPGQTQIPVFPFQPEPSPFQPAQTPSPINLPNQAAMVREGPPPLANIEYIPGFLARNIGKLARAEFILGTSQYVDRTGRLMAVGVNYFVLQDLVSHAMIMCDLYSVRFVTLV
jgi:hypothetical protein